MQRNKVLKGLAGIVGGTILSAAGCGWNNRPMIYLTEGDGVPVKPAPSSIVHDPNCDVSYLISVPIGNTEGSGIDLHARVVDTVKDNQWDSNLTANAYATDNDAFGVDILEGTNTGDQVDWDVEINPSTDVSLGTYKIAGFSASDGIDTVQHCIFASFVPGSTVAPGLMPQIPGGNGSNTADCYSNSDCAANEMCEDGSCVPHQNNHGGLDAYVCGLPRSTGTDIKVYDVNEDANGQFTYTERAELIPGPLNPAAEGNAIYHVVPTGTNGTYSVAVGGEQTGNYTITEVIRSRENARGMTSSVGVRSSECDHAWIFNPNGDSIPPQVFSVTYDSD